jgi:hypothetical protein
MRDAPARQARPALRLLAVVAVVVVATVVRWTAVRSLPPDYDEYDYIRLGHRYAERMSPGRWGEIPAVTENSEHPPLVKLLYGGALKASGAPEPDWKAIEIAKPMPEQARPAYAATRALSAVAGVLQVALTALVSPVGGLWLALDTYHAKFTSQAYLEGVAGLFALLAVLAFERSLRRREPQGLLPAVCAPAAGPLLLSAAFLALATASKYPFGLVVGLTMLPFLLHRTRGRTGLLVAFVATGLTVFVAADPYLWLHPVDRIWGSITYHFSYAVGDHVKQSALPWWQPLLWLTQPKPADWHPGVFPVAFLDRAILVVGMLGLPAAARRRPLFAAWAVVGLIFLLIWPTKWPQYTILVRTPLAVCAGLGLAALLERLRFRRLPAPDRIGP